MSEDFLADCEVLRNPVAESSRLEESLLEEGRSRFESSGDPQHNNNKDEVGQNLGSHNESRDTNSDHTSRDHTNEQEDPKKDEQTEVQELAQLSAEELMEKLDHLKTIAYSLGQSEAHEMTRGRLLDVFGMSKSRR